MRYRAVQLAGEHWHIVDESSGEVDFTKKQAEATAAILNVMERGGSDLDALIDKVNACHVAINDLVVSLGIQP